MDPSLLAEILSLAEKPKLRPAVLFGYTLKRWGKYPALTDGASEEVVNGVVYHVKEKTHAERLAKYETIAFWPTPCRIQFTDGGNPREIVGSTFKYIGHPTQIDDRPSRPAPLAQKVGPSKRQ